MKIICVSVTEEQDTALRSLAPSREYPTMSFLLRVIITDFLAKRARPSDPDKPAKQTIP